MKTAISFIRNTITGGVLFLLPAVLLIYGFNKIHKFFIKISAPLAKKLPDIIWGLDGSVLISILLIIVVCFFSGLLFRAKFVRRFISKIEDKVLSLMPGYSILKSVTANIIGEEITDNIGVVFVEEGNAWRLGFLIEEKNQLCTVFFPSPPKHDTGIIKVIQSKFVKRTNIPINKAAKSLKRYGKGYISFLTEAQILKVDSNNPK